MIVNALGGQQVVDRRQAFIPSGDLSVADQVVLPAEPVDEQAHLLVNWQPSRILDFQRQKSRKPFLCQRTTVSGCIRLAALRQSG